MTTYEVYTKDSNTGSWILSKSYNNWDLALKLFKYYDEKHIGCKIEIVTIAIDNNK
jgi:hypothetical protein